MRQAVSCALLLLLAAARSGAVDAGRFALAQAGPRVSLYVEGGDVRDYSRLAAVLDSAYVSVTAHLDPGFDTHVDVYVYRSQEDLWRDALGTAEPTHRIRGFADVDEGRILITSIYEDCYEGDDGYRVAVHELTHLVYSPGIIWLREGIANYESGRLPAIDGELPTCEADLRFYAHEEETRRAYDASGWLVKFIVEEVGEGSYGPSLTFAAACEGGDARYGDADPYLALGFDDETAFFAAWREYMEARTAATGLAAAAKQAR